jgi:hypothetical protein
MAHDLSCPRCNRRLRVSGESEDLWLTCPRCLGSVRNPRGSQSEITTVSDDGPLPAVGPELSRRPCPSCGNPVERNWRRCPLCEVPLRPGRRSAKRRPPDEDVRQDSLGANYALLALGALLLIGVGLFLATGGLRLVLAERDPKTVIVFGSAVLTVIISGLVAIGMGSRNPGTKLFAGVVGGFVAGAGALCLVIFALCIGVLSTCHGCR